MYGCTTRTLTKCTEKTLDGNITRMLPAVLKNNPEVAPHKAAVVRPPASDLTNNPSKTKKTY